MLRGLGFRSLGFRGLGFRGLGCRVLRLRGLGFRVLRLRGLGFRGRVQGLGFRVYVAYIVQRVLARPNPSKLGPYNNYHMTIICSRFPSWHTTLII